MPRSRKVLGEILLLGVVDNHTGCDFRRMLFYIGYRKDIAIIAIHFRGTGNWLVHRRRFTVTGKIRAQGITHNVTAPGIPEELLVDDGFLVPNIKLIDIQQRIRILNHLHFHFR